tara:strand:+ start:195 stop:491 length:297 start_codon:yes stop_codon:yes gene_type:complete
MTQPHEINPKILAHLDAIDSFARRHSDGGGVVRMKIAESPVQGLQNYNQSHIKNHTCSNCESKVKPKNYTGLTKKEYFISGLCEECQKHFFEPPRETI